MPTTYAIPNGATQFAATLYTGNGTSLTVNNAATTSGTTFQPDFVWIKDRSAVKNNMLVDAVRGVTKYVFSDSTAAELTLTTEVTSLNSNGFSIGNSTNVNTNADAYVGWQWRASNASAVTNTSGSISSQVSANPTAGFSIVTYTGTGANATVGHGLGVAPKMIIGKSRTVANSWGIYHASLGSGTPQNYCLEFNTNAQAPSSAVYWNSTAPTSTVFSIGTFGDVNPSGASQVAYCFAEIDGYSKFGIYTGNGSADGAFVYLGFRPRWLLIKCTSSAGTGWYVYDTSRNTYNVLDLYLRPDASDAQATIVTLDALSNGFKLRTTNTQFNGSGSTYIYAAFAENPFKYANAR